MNGFKLVHGAIYRWYAGCLPGFTLDDVRMSALNFVRGAIDSDVRAR